jgi:molybdopterin converting factor small subunit
MHVSVEFFGIPRQRAGLAAMEVALPDCERETTLGAVLEALSQKLPGFARDCLTENKLRSGYIANISGERFATDPGTIIAEGDTLLILSADVGG